MLNQVVLIGRLARDPELRYTPTKGVAVTKFTLAVDRGGQQEPSADFIDIIVWDKLAELCAQYLSKGKLAAVSGRLQIRPYEKDGIKRRAAEVVADKVRFLSPSGQAQSTQGQSQGHQQPQSTQKKTVDMTSEELMDYLRGPGRNNAGQNNDDDDMPF